MLVLAFIALLAGVYLQSRSGRSRHASQAHKMMSVDMMLSMSAPFAIEVFVEVLTGNTIVSILLAILGALALMIYGRRVLRIEEAGECVVSALMSAIMAAMMAGMPDSAVINLVLIALTVVTGIVGRMMK